MTERDNKYNILIVDDEEYICSIVTEALSANDNYKVSTFSQPDKALTFLENNSIDLVLSDLVMGDYSGIDVLERALQYHPDCIVILMTAYPTVDNAISVLKKGAYDYMVKPFKLENLKNAVRRGLQHQLLARENMHLKEQLALYKLTEEMDSSKNLDTRLNIALDTARTVIGSGAISILINDNASETPIVYLKKGKEKEGELKDLLDGNHRVCREAIEKKEAVFECRKIKQPNGYESLSVHPLIAQGRVIGTLNVVQEDRFLPLKVGQLKLLSMIASKIAAAIENNRLMEKIQSSYLKAIKALANAIEARDRHTRGHTERVTVLAELIANRLGWPEQLRARVKMGCTLHDIGKIGVPDAILNKPGHLTEEERSQIEVHPKLGAKILEGIDFLKPAIPYILYHHEKYDGTGYPHKLKGEEIPPEGRLLAVVDTYDAIVSDRPYRKGAESSKAIDELKKFRGIQFDPAIVDALVEAWEEGLIDSLGLYPNIDAETIHTSPETVNS